MLLLHSFSLLSPTFCLGDGYCCKAGSKDGIPKLGVLDFCLFDGLPSTLKKTLLNACASAPAPARVQ